ncbi:hypothetical protein NQ318_022966 [Aromia moschata]|uniref:Reverse transcriptase RNase H-like domain-containing protein n=1 Tax=Aromia moschata TaxID=1265417 RepID=A0AAV8YBM5_9CUCU|nr:hypothetical protein NQ318_022966 [Aromia moschata]
MVIPELPRMLILGQDFWIKMGIVPDLRSKEWHFSDHPEVFSLQQVRDKTVLTKMEQMRLQAVIEQNIALMGVPFTAVTDHYSLKWLHNLKDSSRTLTALGCQIATFIERAKIISCQMPCQEQFPVIDAVEHNDAEKIILDRWYQKMVQNVQEHPLKYRSWRVSDVHQCDLFPYFVIYGVKSNVKSLNAFPIPTLLRDHRQPPQKDDQPAAAADSPAFFKACGLQQ